MIFRQVLHADLGCASYVVADGGEAIVVDPKWEIQEYLDLAQEYGFRIAHVVETHNHADHVSGKGLLFAATGATIHISHEAAVDYPHQPLSEGNTVEVGGVRLTAVSAPGHRPEHMIFALADTSLCEATRLVLTGDSLLVGEVARPNLAVDATRGARDLHRSLRRLAAFDDGVEIWPAHIGGSLCGGGRLSGKPSSTVGYERRTNVRFQTTDESAFVSEITSRLGPRPSNHERIVDLNQGPLLTILWPVTRLSPQHVERLLGDGAVLIDGRESSEFDSAHVPGSLSVRADRKGVGTRAVWAADPEQPVIVTAGREAVARRMTRSLEAVGFRQVLGLLAGGVGAWIAAGLEVGATRTMAIQELARQILAARVTLLDVRDEEEWEASHVPRALHIPCRELRERLPSVLAVEQPVAVACATGTRSALAASLLERAGLERVYRVAAKGIPDLAPHGVELVGAA